MRYTSLQSGRFLGKKRRVSCAKASLLVNKVQRYEKKDKKRNVGSRPPENTICFVFWVNSTTQEVTCTNVVHYEALVKILFTLKPDNGHFLQGWHPAIFA